MELEMEMESILQLSWIRVVEEFSLRYDSIFLQTTAKAHLDFSSCIVDGAKDKWCQVVLLDTIIAFQEGFEPKQSQQKRRQFNQYLALRESIIVVASEEWIGCIKSNKMDVLNSIDIKMPKRIAIYDTAMNNWDSIDNLKNHLSTKNKYRTKIKQEKIVDKLLDVISSKNETIHDVLLRLVQKIYIDHFHLSDSDRIKNKEDLNFVEGNEYFENLEEFCVSFIDALKRESSSQGIHPSNLFGKYYDEFGSNIKKQKLSEVPQVPHVTSNSNSSLYFSREAPILTSNLFGIRGMTAVNINKKSRIGIANSMYGSRLDNNVISQNNALVQALMQISGDTTNRSVDINIPR